ncbi:MAG: ABC transporter permease [Chloroflexi bacterium]|nr:MAG: ABC transporter permease [Chloroflexota bacterium]
MTGYVIRRILWMIPVLWAVATITFFLMHAVPGGPFSQEKQVSPTALANLNAKYDLDKPILEQYGLFFWHLGHADLGTSFSNQRPVLDIIKEGWPITAELGVTAFVFALAIGMTMGVISALNHNKLPDYLGVFFATAGTAMPSFVIGTFLVIIFSVKLGWFDVLGWEFGNYRKMVLPVITLGTLPAAYIARVTRASLLEVLNQDYIRTARSKGLAEYVVVLRHTIKNAMIPILTVVGPIFAFLVTGSFITESIFVINGIGKRFVDSVFARDYGLIMGTTLFYAAIVAFANLAVDLLYATVDPRIRYS